MEWLNWDTFNIALETYLDIGLVWLPVLPLGKWPSSRTELMHYYSFEGVVVRFNSTTFFWLILVRFDLKSFEPLT